MKALLMYRDRDFDMQQELPRHAGDLTQDLELNIVLSAMAGEDEFLLEVAQKALLSSLHGDVGTILHRQAILKDCLNNPALVRELYALAVEAIEGKKKHYIGIISNYPSGTLYDAIRALEFFTGILARLKAFADAHAARFRSGGFTVLLAMLQREFAEEYFLKIQNRLRDLKFKAGVLVSAELGKGNEGANFVLRQPHGKAPNWLERLLGGLLGKKPPGYTFRLHDRDEVGARILSQMRDRGINLVANALAQSTDHILSFFQMLRTELGFYVGCLNLHDKLASRGAPTSFPRPGNIGQRALRFSSLHDVGLVLAMETKVVGNALDADDKSLILITGANQGGKSSFLRGIGLAQLMMQCGMFVVAESFAAELCAGLFTHYRREEDATMKSGKLDEELSRMSGIIDAIAPDSMLLFNESFASTNEREGSEIAGQIARALVQRRVKVLFVTHLYEFAHGLFENNGPQDIFLHAERLADGTRTFKIVVGEPLETSYGEDLYARVFETPSIDGSTTDLAGDRGSPGSNIN
jgi:MutS domain V